MNTSRARRAAAAAAMVGALVLIPAGVAYASTYETIGATNPCSNCLVQHSAPRYHSAGVVTFQPTSIPGCGGELRLGLRNTSGVQFTPSVAWTLYVTKIFNSGNPVSAQGFYMNSNLVGDCSVAGTTWSGTLMY